MWTVARVMLSALSAAIVMATVAAAYDCNVHFVRNIGGQNTSLRDLCRNASPTLNDWPICACNNLPETHPEKIVSNTDATECEAGYTEIGRCVRNADYYRTCLTCSGTTCTSGCTAGCGTIGAYCPSSAVHHTFVPSPAECGEASSHEVLSTVEGCKALCDKYLKNRFFDQNDQSQDGYQTGTQYGSWRLGTHPTIPDLNNIIFDSVRKCKDKCGPPNSLETQPPWGDDTENHWRYVTFARWNPNSALDGWLRSYSVNKDKPDAPAGECEKLVKTYCESPSVTSPPHLAAKRTQCKKNLFLWLHLLPVGYSGQVDFINPTAFDFSANTTPPKLADDRFCDHFFRGNYLATSTCYRPGDGQINTTHRCSQEGGTLPGETCNDLLATCEGGSPPEWYPVATIWSPAKATHCGTPTVVTGGSVLLSAAYGGSTADVVSATWENRKNGSKGALVASLFGWISYTADRQQLIGVPLVVGQINRVRVRFVDKNLRVSGDIIEIDAQ